MADTRIKPDGSTEHKCHSCGKWKPSRLFKGYRDPDGPKYLMCPECR